MADAATKVLSAKGWSVIRPELSQEALTGRLKWGDYLEWVRQMSVQGVPVLEIHGQDLAPGCPVQATGVVAREGAPLVRNPAPPCRSPQQHPTRASTEFPRIVFQGKHLAEGAGFGRYPLPWTSLAVPQRGGTLLEAFEPEKVLDIPATCLHGGQS